MTFSGSAADEPDPNPDPSAQLGRGDLQSRAIRGAMWTIIHIGLSLPIAFAVNILLARVLGVIDYGRLTYLSTVMGIVAGIVSTGVGTGLTQFGAKSHAAGRVKEVQRLLSKSQGFRLLFAVPVLSTTVVMIAQIDLVLLLVALVFGVFLPSALAGGPACLTIENKTDRGAQHAIVVNLLTQVSVVAVVLSVGTADAVWAVRLIVAGIGVGLSLVFIAPAYRRAVFRPAIPRSFPPGFWRFAVPAGAAGLIGSLLVSRTEVLFLTWFSTLEAAGIFALAFGLASHIFSPAHALIGPLVPAISALREVDEAAVARALIRTLRATATLSALLTASALPALAVLVPTIYGTEFENAAPVTLALGVAGGALLMSGPVHAFVQARLLGVRLLWVNLGALVANVVVAVLTIPTLGVWGAVLASVMGAGAQLTILLGGEIRALELRWVSTVANMAPLVVGAISSVVAWFAGSAVDNPWLGAAVAACVGAGASVVSMRLLRIGLARADAEAVTSVLPARFRTVGLHLLGLVTTNRPLA